MTQQIINIGVAPNSGDGDPLRTAFEKINQNFSQLYQFAGNNAAPPDSSVQYRATNSMTCIGYSNGRWVVFGQPDRYFVSTDGTNWNNVEAPVSAKINDVVATPLGFLAVGSNGTIITSSDNGATWTVQASGTTRNLHSVHYNAITGRAVAVGQHGVVCTSQNQITWVQQASGVTTTLYGIAYNGAGSGYVAVGDSGTAVLSLDGDIWTTQNSETTAQLNSVTYDGASYIAVGNNGTITASVNGVDWVVKISGTTQDLSSVTSGIIGSTFYTIAVGTNGVVISSSDGAGTVWTPINVGTINTLTDITWTGANFYACGLQGTILVATTLTSWSNVGVPGTFAGSGLFTYNDTTATLTVPNIVAGNITTQIFTPNIIAANQIIAYNFASLPDAGNLKIFGGENGQVLSTDGTGNLSWITANGGGNTNYSNANVAAYLPTYDGNIAANNITVAGNVVGNVNGLVHGIDIRYLVFDFAYLQPNTYNNPIQYLLAKTGDVEFGTFTVPTPLNIDFGTF
jgi:hypothetical protein